MPYGDLRQQIVQRFSTLSDLALHKCTIEEMEEYEPHIMRGNVIYSGVDYHDILREAEDDEKGCDFIVWDGGNNDMPFYNPDLMITITDPHRVGHESSYYPSEVNIRKSDVVIINKIDSANGADVMELRKNIQTLNTNAVVVDAVSPIRVDNPEVIKGKKVLVVEDGPTLTHGEMKFGAAYLAAQKYGASEIVDPREYAVGSIKTAFEKYPHISNVLPAIGYGTQQIKDLEQTIKNIPCDSIIIGTPIDLSRVVNLYKSFTRVHYDLQEIGKPDLQEILDTFIDEH